MSAEPKLKPCPFCGGRASVCKGRRGGWSVECMGPDLECTAQIDRQGTEERAIAAWNRRAPVEES